MNNCTRLWPALLCLSLYSCMPAAQAWADPLPDTPAPRLQSLLELSEAEPSTRSLPIKAWKTLSGTKVLFIRTTELPMLDVHVSFAAGSVKDLDQPGLAAMTFSLLNESVPGKDVATVYESLGGLGAQLGMDIDQERSTFSLRSLSDSPKRIEALELFYQVLGTPELTDEALARVKKEIGDKLESQKQNPGHLANERMKALLATGTRYASPVFGTAEGLQSITRDNVQNFYRQAYAASRTQITLVGDLSVEQAKDISQQISKALPDPPPVMESSTPLVKPSATPMSSHIERDQGRTHLLLAQYSVPREHADYPALQAAGLIFANDMSSRLMTELREKRGLVYAVDMGTMDRAGGGITHISLQTAPQFSQGTLTLVQSMLSDYLREGPTQQELDRLQSSIASRSALALAGNGNLLRQLSKINRYNLPLDLDFTHQQMKKLTITQIKTALNKHLAADQWRVVTVGPTQAQQPLPQPVLPSTDPSEQSMCRAEAGFVAS